MYTQSTHLFRIHHLKHKFNGLARARTHNQCRHINIYTYKYIHTCTYTHIHAHMIICEKTHTSSESIILNTSSTASLERAQKIKASNVERRGFNLAYIYIIYTWVCIYIFKYVHVNFEKSKIKLYTDKWYSLVRRSTRCPLSRIRSTNSFTNSPFVHSCESTRYSTFWPMNHVKKIKGWPLRDAPLELVQLMYKTFPPDHYGQVEMKTPTILSNKSSTAWSCAEDQILENKISGCWTGCWLFVLNDK